MLHKYSLIGVIIIFLFSTACAGTFQPISQDLQKGMNELRIAIKENQGNWVIWVHFLKKALEDELSAKYIDVLDEMNTIIMKDELTDADIGDLLGLQSIIGTPIFKAFIQKFASELLGIPAFLAIIGL